MSEQIVDPSLRPADPAADSRSRRRVGIVLFVVGFVIILIGGFWPALAQWFFIGGSLFLIIGVTFFGRRFRDSEADRDIRKLYGGH